MLNSKKAGISCHSIENGQLGFEGKLRIFIYYLRENTTSQGKIM
jgi:hypothetical protein